MNTLKKEELRIGNWVAFKNKSNSFGNTTLTESCFEGNYIEKTFGPIKISRNWLIDIFKFRIPTHGIPEQTYYEYNRDVRLFIICHKNRYFCNFRRDNNYTECKQIEFVHELQNYAALFNVIL